MGNGAVISCDPSRLRWAQQHLEGLHRDELFAPATIAKMEAFVQRDGQSMAGPDLKYFCARSNLCSEVSLQGISFELLRDGAVSNLYNMTGFSHALQYRMSTDRPDVLACVARVGDSVVGVAGASADCDTLWQIGIDVLEQSRRQGIGKALLTRLTQAVLDAERLPYYSTVSSNIASRALAINVGYRPVWIEMYAR